DIYLTSKENNDKLQAVNQKIAKSEDELRYLLKESSMRVWRSTFKDRKVTFYQDLRNPEMQMSIDDFVKGTYSDYDCQMALNFVEPPVSEVTPKSMVMAVKDIFSGHDVKRWYSINRIPECDSEGNVTGCFGLIRDISELIEAQLMLKKETQRANESEQQKSVFLANMSHEIRTPLNAIVGFCDLLQSIDSPDDRKEFIRIIRNNCNMLLHLINDILIISSMDSNGLAIEPHKVDFAESFNDVCATFVQQISEKGLQFIEENPYKSFVTEIDDDRIQQVIINFITNAIKHTQSGHIRVGYKAENGGLLIYCEDTGSGIPKEKCEDVFKRFVKLNDFVQGTGLGLSICKAIADSCGGRIGVDSELGKGSCFHIWIPCETIKEEQKEA
ncbi:MAG: sensor histidine kinase, partial [Prevotella sp.]